MKKLNETKHSMKLMWGCMAFAVLAIVLIIGGVGAGALFIIPCMLLMGAMLWIMMGGAGGKLARRARREVAATNSLV